MARNALICALVAVLACAASASEFEHKNVEILKQATFADKVGDGGIWFIKFYAPWCGHCKRLGPDWGKLADAFSSDPKINIAQVDCTVDRDVCSKFEVKGYPTLKVIQNGEEAKPYRGARSLEALSTFVQETAKELLTETTT